MKRPSLPDYSHATAIHALRTTAGDEQAYHDPYSEVEVEVEVEGGIDFRRLNWLRSRLPGRHSQVVRQRPAKPLFPGSNPGAASISDDFPPTAPMPRCRQTRRRDESHGGEWWNGIHGGLKIRCRKACGFDSRLAHQRLFCFSSRSAGFTKKSARAKIAPTPALYSTEAGACRHGSRLGCTSLTPKVPRKTARSPGATSLKVGSSSMFTCWRDSETS